MFWNRNSTEAIAEAKDRVHEHSNGIGLPFDLSSLPDAVRFERYGHAVAASVPALVHKLPSTDEALDAISSTAQKALPGRFGKKRRGPRPLLIAMLVFGTLVGGFVLFKRFTGGGDQEEDEWAQGTIDPQWPARPATGDTGAPSETDAQAAADAAQSVAVRTHLVDAQAGDNAEGSGATQ